MSETLYSPKRKLSLQEVNVSKKIYEILDRISTLQAQQKREKKEQKPIIEIKKKPLNVPALTFIKYKIPARSKVAYRRNSLTHTQPIEIPKRVPQKVHESLISYTESDTSKHSNLITAKERYKKIMNLASSLISKSSIKGWA